MRKLKPKEIRYYDSERFDTYSGTDFIDMSIF